MISQEFREHTSIRVTHIPLDREKKLLRKRNDKKTDLLLGVNRLWLKVKLESCEFEEGITEAKVPSGTSTGETDSEAASPVEFLSKRSLLVKKDAETGNERY